jgi:hypothetical protein
MLMETIGDINRWNAREMRRQAEAKRRTAEKKR